MVQMSLTFLATLILIVLVKYYSAKKGKINYKLLLASFINSFIWASVVFIYEDYVMGQTLEVYLFIGSLIEYLLVVMTIFIMMNKVIILDKYQEVLKKTLGETKYSHYYIVDESNKIKDMSEAFLLDLGKTLDDVLGKRIFDVFDETISFTTIDDVPQTNQGIRNYYKKPIRTKSTLNAQFRNVNKDLISILIIDEPVIYKKKYLGRISIAERYTEGEVLEVKKDLNNKALELNKIQHRFISTLRVVSDSLLFLDLSKKTIWINDNLKRMLNLDFNDISISDFQRYINPDDLRDYNDTLSNSLKNGKYEAYYKFRIAGSYSNIKEYGVVDQTKSLIVSRLEIVGEKVVKNNTLASLKDEFDLEGYIERLQIYKKEFELVIFSIKNIKSINERRGVHFGDIAIEEYVKKIKERFAKNKDVYRLSGVDFAFVLDEVRNMDLLYRGLKADSKVLNLDIELGKVFETIEVSLGISRMNVDAKNAKDLINAAKVALSEAKSNKSVKNYCYYRDLK